MRKALLIPVIALILVSIAGLVMFSYEGGFGGGSGGAGRGFGAQGAAGAQSSGLDSVWLVVFAVPLAVALVAVGYMAAFPEIKTVKTKEVAEGAEEAKQSQTLEAILRVLNDDEKKVVQALAEAKEGAMLQKDIRWKTGMTRVKTHRVLARLATRDIIHAEKHYNTNKITLNNWITTNNNIPRNRNS